MTSKLDPWRVFFVLVCFQISSFGCDDKGDTSRDGAVNRMDGRVRDASIGDDSAVDGFVNNDAQPATDGTHGDGGADAMRQPQLFDLVEKQRYVTDLQTIAAERVPQNAHWQTVQDLCYTRLESLGFTVTRQSYTNSGAQDGVNVIGIRQGTTTPDEHIILSAHYDHIAGCSGADDNGSGVAALLEAARVLVTQDYQRTLIVACWDEGEAQADIGNLTSVGSGAYAGKASADGDDIKMVYVMDMIGYTSAQDNSQTIPQSMRDLNLFNAEIAAIEGSNSRGDFVFALGARPEAVQAAAAFSAAAGLIGLRTLAKADLPTDNPTLSSVKDVFNSDHAPFWLFGYPALFITDTGPYRNPHYHCLDGDAQTPDTDVVNTLEPHDFAVDVTRAVVGSVETLLRPVP